MRGGGSIGGGGGGGGGWLSSSSCGDISGLWGSGTRVGSTSEITGMRSSEVEIWSMFFFWMRSKSEGLERRRGRRPTCIQKTLEMQEDVPARATALR